MDTVDNGREPLGEDPAASGFQIFGTEHLGGNVVEKIIVAADEMAAHRQAVDEIRETVEHLLGEPRQHQGVRQAARTIAAILQRHGLT